MIRRTLLLLAGLVLFTAFTVSAQSLDLGPRFSQWGIAEDGVNTVRIGENHGNATSIALRVEAGWVRADVWWMQTGVWWWPAGTENGPNPGTGPGSGRDDVSLYGLTMGPGLRAGWVGLSGMAGGIAMTCAYHDCGSSPLFGWLLAVDMDVCTPGTFRACVRAGMSGVPPREGRWTWMTRDRAGYDPSVPHTAGGGWIMQRYAGLSVGVTF